MIKGLQPWSEFATDRGALADGRDRAADERDRSAVLRDVTAMDAQRHAADGDGHPARIGAQRGGSLHDGDLAGSPSSPATVQAESRCVTLPPWLPLPSLPPLPSHGEADAGHGAVTRGSGAAARDRAASAVDRAAAAEDRVWASRAVLQLTQALGSAREIGIALGIIVEQSDCTPDEAFAMLAELSQTSNVKLRELARQIVDRRG